MALSSRGAAKGDTSLLAIPERFFLLLSQTEIIFCCSVVTLTGWVVLNWLNFVYMLWRVFFFLDSDLCKTTVSYRSTLGETLCSSFAAVMGIYNVRFWHILPHLKSPVLLSQASSFGYILFLLSSSLALFPNRIKLSWWLLRASYPTVLLLLVFLLIAPVLFLQKPPTPKENHRPNNGMDGSLKTARRLHTHSHKNTLTHTSGFSLKCLSLYISPVHPRTHTIVFLSLLNLDLLDHSHCVQLGQRIATCHQHN